MRQTIGTFLLRRLEEVGVRHIFGVPGDYNLELLQQLEDAGRLEWVGNCNELNASYAADGYARLAGLGVVVVTNGVGALSALNGIAGSFSEHVPVICICGAVPQSTRDHGNLMHHTLADDSFDPFYKTFSEVTTAQAQISPENAAIEIDRLILTAWRRKLPVYLELPSDIAYLSIEVPETPLVLAYTPSDELSLKSCSQKIISRLRDASSPLLLLGIDALRFRVVNQVEALAKKLQIPVALMTEAKGIFPEQSPLYAGMYGGAASNPALCDLIEKSDCLLTIGFRRVDWNTGFFTDKIPGNAIHLRGHSVDVDNENFQAVFLVELLTTLVKEAPTTSKQPRGPFIEAKKPSLPTPNQGPLRQKEYWQAIQQFIQPGDVLIAEAGTSGGGALGLTLPPGTTFVNQLIWGSIGYTVGCLLGTLLAAPGRRHVLLVGDGSFQLTAQEISTIRRLNLKPFILLINNGGYTVEKTILGRNAKYNEVANWRYTDLVKSFCRTNEINTSVVNNSEELDRALSFSLNRMTFVEVVMSPNDSPVNVVRSGHAAAKLNYGALGPQLVAGAQIVEHEY